MIDLQNFGMKIKRLELMGFKSFVDPTVVNFDASIIGIVGPNGCGKSNVVDAIRWVMGEQSAKSLRGHAMEDVIFNGSDSRPPLGMAEVALTFSTEDGIVPPEYAGFSEITITRRLYRSGESEYLINKTACRLRDIVELFLGTGVGHRAYSVIEQGRIDFAINAKPEDRRLLIEEAAGISKFKSRKEAALRKMDGTKNNLSRLKDILGEVTRQINSLDRQVKKAEKYKLIKMELREKELQLISVRFLEESREQGEINTLLADWLERDTNASISMIKFETQLEEQRLLLMEKERELNGLQEQFFESSTQQKLLSTQEQFQKKEKTALEEQKLRSLTGMEQCKEQLLRLQQEIQEQIARHESEHGKSGDLNETLQTVEARWQEVESQRLKLSLTIQDIKSELQRNDSEASRIEGERRLYEERNTSLRGQSAKIVAELQEVARLQQEVTERFHVFKNDQQALAARQTSIKSEGETLHQEIANLKQHKELLEEEFSFRQEDLVQKRSRLKSLLDLEKNFEGYDEGVRSILKAKKEGTHAAGIFGVVADFLETPPQYETALSAALGEQLQHIIVKSHEAGVEAIGYLKTESLGRGTFISVDTSEIVPSKFPYQGHGVIGPLLDFVHIKEECRSIGRYLLGDIILVESLSKALALWRDNGPKKTLVTLEGEVVDPHGVVTGGTNTISGKILLEKKREIKELRGIVSEMEEDLSLREDAISQAEGSLSELTFDLEGLEKKEHELEIKSANLEKEIALLSGELQRFDRERERLLTEQGQAGQEEERIATVIRDSEQRRLTITNDRQEKGATLEQMAQEERRLQLEVKQLAEALTGAKVQSAAMQERQAMVDQERERLQKTEQELMARIEGEASTITEIHQKLAQLDTSLSQSAEEEVACKARVEELANAQEDVRKIYEGLAAEVRGLEDSIKHIRKESELCNSHINDLRLTLTQLDSNVHHAEQNIFEKYSVSLKETAIQYQGIEIDREAEELVVNELKEKIERLGDVNLGAIPEYEELKTRQTFLEQQIEDLEISLDALQKAIHRINQTTLKRFEETFALVSQRFETLLPRLFRGGRAELRLTEPSEEHPNPGVELLVQPPGKKLSHISLLSGGEKALAAVGFIFSIFLVKPSPFCILDEVDAPLDDVNVERFQQLIAETVSRSQFILITHNRRTMEHCQLLYGVTMQEPGISRTVSVRLQDDSDVALAS